MHKRTQQRAAKGFSLVELLVVIALIGMLITLAASSLTSARDNARAVKCISNLRQQAAACLLHALNKGKLPYAVTQTADMNVYLPDGLWLQDCLIPYVGGEIGNINEIFHCPSVRQHWMKDDPESNHYRYNIPQAAGRDISKVHDTSSAILTFDTAWPDWPEPDLPHKGIQASYVDGHADAVPADLFYTTMENDLNSTLMKSGWHE